MAEPSGAWLPPARELQNPHLNSTQLRDSVGRYARRSAVVAWSRSPSGASARAAGRVGGSLGDVLRSDHQDDAGATQSRGGGGRALSPRVASAEPPRGQRHSPRAPAAGPVRTSDRSPLRRGGGNR